MWRDRHKKKGGKTKTKIFITRIKTDINVKLVGV